MRERRGFTLVELLVAMAITGVILTAIGGFVIGTLRFSSTSQSASERLREVTNALGYVVDNVRSAGTVVDCGTNCIELRRPSVSGISLLGTEDVLRYVIVGRGDASVSPTWIEPVEGGGFVLLEERAGDPFLVLDHLTAASAISFDAAEEIVELAVQVEHRSASGTQRTPAGSPYSVVVAPRNR